MQAATRVNSEQASKVQSWAPTGLRNREGRRAAGKQPTCAPAATAGVVETACRQGVLRNVGDPRGGRGCARRRREERRPSGESDRLIVARKRRNGRGAKGPDFGALVKEPEGEGLA